jgi:hypothetical protein
MPNLNNVKLTTEGITVTSTAAGASADIIYTVPDNYSAIIKFLHLSNGTNSTKKVSVQFYHVDDTSYHYILNQYAMAGNSAYDILAGNELSLHQGDKIVAYAEAGTVLDVTISVQEYYDPARQ